MINYTDFDIITQLNKASPGGDPAPEYLPCCELCGEIEDLRAVPMADGWPVILCLDCEQEQQRTKWRGVVND